MKIFFDLTSGRLNKKSFNLRRCFIRNIHPSDAKTKIDADEKKDRTWINSPQGRSQMMKLVNHSPPMQHILPVDMNDYIQQRYGIISSSDSLENRILSSLLTFPLSLSLGINQIFGVIPKFPLKLFDLNVLVVGARSEATLPKLWWKETLVCCPSLRHLNIQFMGPHHNHITSPPSSNNPITAHIDFQPFTLEWTTLNKSNSMIIEEDANHEEFEDSPTCSDSCNNEHALSGIDNLHFDGRRKLTVSNLRGGRCKLHEYADLDQLSNRFDLFVLFNPGYGSTSLQDSWKDSMKWLIRSKKPVLCTSHSEYDMSRDLKMLESYIDVGDNDINSSTDEYVDESVVYDDDYENNSGVVSSRGKANRRWYVKPDLNSFRSQRSTFDPREDHLARVVTTNEHIYSFQIIDE